MMPSRSSKDMFYEKEINPYLPEVMKQPQSIEMPEGVLHIRVIQGTKKQGNQKAMLVAMEHEIFMCQGIMEHGLSANHSMITDFSHENKKDNTEIVEIIFNVHEKFQDLQAQIFDVQNENYS
ncbi:40S ribosomal protein S5-1 [Hordeum vulgare]|nr:40S ribosomal protein S5-1 [Hordeum vulgare]